MTEAEWLTCTNAATMRLYLGDRLGARKLWLFACACCRATPGYLESPHDRLVLEAAERHIDGVNSLDAMHNHFAATAWDIRFHRLDAWGAAARALEAYFVEVEESRPESSEDEARLLARPADLFREVAGNPFRPAAVDPTWLTWGGGAVAEMARRIYGERDYDAMPVLADALEEAGCTDADVLSHARAPGGHVHGCWLLDRLLGQRYNGELDPGNWGSG